MRPHRIGDVLAMVLVNPFHTSTFLEASFKKDVAFLKKDLHPAWCITKGCRFGGLEVLTFYLNKLERLRPVSPGLASWELRRGLPAAAVEDCSQSFEALAEMGLCAKTLV